MEDAEWHMRGYLAALARIAEEKRQIFEEEEAEEKRHIYVY